MPVGMTVDRGGCLRSDRCPMCAALATGDGAQHGTDEEHDERAQDVLKRILDSVHLQREFDVWLGELPTGWVEAVVGDAFFGGRGVPQPRELRGCLLGDEAGPIFDLDRGEDPLVDLDQSLPEEPTVRRPDVEQQVGLFEREDFDSFHLACACRDLLRLLPGLSRPAAGSPE